MEHLIINSDVALVVGHSYCRPFHDDKKTNDLRNQVSSDPEMCLYKIYDFPWQALEQLSDFESVTTL